MPSSSPDPQSGNYTAADVSSLKRRIVTLEQEVKEAAGMCAKKALCVLPPVLS